ncbi:LacI family DNA-binding transcriptional regulator [Brachybacterium sp. GCM10030252]|uniref:LacI family DNA-binding transcriptional regulator n=2 Tax=unclassified Brachybacterium TaxID=2623841 RepID=UPI00360ACE76
MPCAQTYWGMPQNRVTIADLAREAGVNKSAVSRALSGKPGVSEETRSRVLDLAHELGWRPNSTARSLSRAQSGAIGWVMRRTPKSSTVDPFAMDQLIGVQMELSRTPYNLVLKLVDTMEDELQVYSQWHAERRVDGILLPDLEIDDPRTAFLRERDIPMSTVADLVDFEPSDANAAAGAADYESTGVREIMSHLLEKGHRRIGWIGGPAQFVATRRRLDALDAWRTRFDTVTTACTSHGPTDIAQEAVSMQDAHDLTAVVVDNELAAIETIAQLRLAGRAVPRDVSVVSWLGSDLCLLSDPTLTSLQHDIAGLGRLWTRGLLAKVYSDEPGTSTPPADPILHARASTD